MELYKAIKEIVTCKGAEMINDIQIINYLLDYQAFKEKTATKAILRDVINAGYGESILALLNDPGWQIKLKQYQHEFIDLYGYKEELVAYVFDSIAYAMGLIEGRKEPAIKTNINVDFLLDLPSSEEKQKTPGINQQQQTNRVDSSDLYSIALSFFNEGKYQQAKGFIEKALVLYQSTDVPSIYLKLMGDIHMKLDFFEEAIKYYNESFARKAAEESYNSINAVKEALKNHKLKGYENTLYCYYFCGYSIKVLNKEQWLQFVKNEARFGLMDAIKYCAENRINPIETHFDIYFTDINKLKSGDYLYEDGTFAHEQSKAKKAIAKIVLTETTEYEKTQGWNHGYIIPLEIAKRNKANLSNTQFVVNPHTWGKKFMWAGFTEDLPFPHSHYSIDDLNHWDDINKIESEQFVVISNYKDFPAFNAVKQYHIKLPLSNTSGWLLPNIHQIKMIHKKGKYLYCPQEMEDVFEFWTSSQMDKYKAISYSTIGFNEFSYGNKTELKGVLPIAVF